MLLLMCRMATCCSSSSTVEVRSDRLAEREQLTLFPQLLGNEPGDARATLAPPLRANLAAVGLPGGRVVAGVVHNPESGEEWTAERGRGAFLNGARLGAVKPKDRIEILSFEATTTADGMGAILRSPGAPPWNFRVRGGMLTIEESLWIDGRARPHNVTQLVVVGEVVALRERLAWFERRPCFAVAKSSVPAAGSSR